MKVRIRRQKKSIPRLSILLFLLISLIGVGSYITYSRFSPVGTSSSFSIVNEAESPDTTGGQKKPQGDSIYRSILKNADDLFNKRKYEEALPEYEKALKLKPADASVKDRIAKMKTLIPQEKKNNEDFLKAMTSGDNYFKVKDYLNAKASFQVAIDLKPDDQPAKDKLKTTMDQLRSQKATNILYDVAIASAEKLFMAKEYEKARIEYEKASKVLPSDQYAKDRINECIKIMIDQKTRDETYAKSIADADIFYAAKNYQGALLEYQNASPSNLKRSIQRTGSKN